MAAPRPFGAMPAANPIPSSSPAFGTPVHPINPRRTVPIPAPNFKSATILPVILPPASLRPLAFRTFTKKHNLTLSSSALAAISSFIGKHCGAGWREDGLAEGVLEEAAKIWKKEGGEAIVKGESDLLKNILKILEGSMSGGKIMPGKSGLSRQSSFAINESGLGQSNGVARPGLYNQESFGLSSLEVQDEEDEEDAIKDPREWIKVLNAFEQPKWLYNTQKKHFEKSTTAPTLFPPPSQKTDLFRQRYHVTHQRILRHESFQTPSFLNSRPSASQTNKITPIANLLGRSGSSHLLLGLLSVAPTGTLALSDLTGTIQLDTQHARPFPDVNSAWFAPGMIVLVEGVYTEDYTHTAESALGNTGGIGGTIGGKFLGALIAHPPCERRTTTLGIQENGSESSILSGPAFGWTDFLGVGSERATGSRMRKLERKILGPGAPHVDNGKVVIASELHLDNLSTLPALRILLSTYASLPAAEIPMSFVFMGNFISQAALSGASNTGSIEYKEHFDALASTLAEFPQLIARSTLIFVPGDNDAWASSFSASAAVPLPRKPLPEMFTNRIRRAVAEANREIGGSGRRKEGEVIWASNPARLAWFGVKGEMVAFRDDLSGRLRRTGLSLGVGSETGDSTEEPVASAAPAQNGDSHAMDIDKPGQAATTLSENDSANLASRRLTKTLLDQAHLSPFPLSVRPVHWDYAHSLSLYPLPTALVVADPEAPPFVLNYMGCAVMNPGGICGERKTGARWVEYQVLTNRASIRVEDG